MFWKIAVTAVVALLIPTTAPFGTLVAARYRTGSIPPVDIRAIGGGEVLVEADVAEDGRVAAVKTLRSTPPFTRDVLSTVRGWTFSPALQELPARENPQLMTRRRIKSKVLIASWFRPPTLFYPTLGTRPSDVSPPSAQTPFPITTAMPVFPLNALLDGSVLLEVHVGPDGRTVGVQILRSAAIFDSAAMDALRKWRFRPARFSGVPVDGFVYVTFAFRQPVTPSK